MVQGPGGFAVVSNRSFTGLRIASFPNSWILKTAGILCGIVPWARTFPKLCTYFPLSLRPPPATSSWALVPEASFAELRVLPLGRRQKASVCMARRACLNNHYLDNQNPECSAFTSKSQPDRSRETKKMPKRHRRKASKISDQNLAGGISWRYCYCPQFDRLTA